MDHGACLVDVLCTAGTNQRWIHRWFAIVHQLNMVLPTVDGGQKSCHKTDLPVVLELLVFGSL